MTEPLLKVENLTKHFPGKRGATVRAVEDVSFQIGRGEVLGLVGESGSGKSTTGRLILRLIEPTAGRVFYEDRDVFAMPKKELRELRREMQIVFQDPYGAFNPRMTVGGIIGEALELRDARRWDRTRRKSETCNFLEMVGMPTDILHRYPHEFSGGQRQRIGIARALAVNPKFIIADEPVSALDVSTQAEIVNLLLDLQKNLNLTMLFIAHDLSVVKILSDRIAVMYAGRILEMASGASLFQNPLQPYTQELLRAIPIPDPKRARRAVQTTDSDEEDTDQTVAAIEAAGCPYAGRCPFTMEICRQQMPPLVDYAPRLKEDAPHWAACHWVEQNGEV